MKKDKKIQRNEKRLNRLAARKPVLSGIISIILTLLASAALLVAILFIILVLYKADSKLFNFFNADGSILIIVISLGIFASAVAIMSFFGFSEGAVAAKSKSGQLRFPRLCTVDIENKKNKKETEEKSVSLGEICTGFRDFAAYRFGLYYDISTIRSFIADLCVSKLMIIQGISGTGKTSIAWAFGEYLGNGTNIISVQPSWKEKSDLIGYYNEFTGKYNETPFLEALYKSTYSDKMTITLLDEMNIARVEYYFAEFLSMLEINDDNKRLIDVIADSKPNDPAKINEGRLHIPGNVWYIGTANRDDSTYTIADKVYDRAMILQLDKRSEAFEASDTDTLGLSEKSFEGLKKEALQNYPLSNRMHTAVSELDAYLAEKLGITFGNRIMSQYCSFVPCYVACRGSEEEATDIFVSTKILRKLESKSALLIKKECAGLLEEFDRLFGPDSMQNCRKYLSRFEK